jgi:hypothetical protein
MQLKQQISTALTVALLILIGLRFAGYRDYIPSAVIWIGIAAQFGIRYLWKPKD